MKQNLVNDKAIDANEYNNLFANVTDIIGHRSTLTFHAEAEPRRIHESDSNQSGRSGQTYKEPPQKN